MTQLLLNVNLSAEHAQVLARQIEEQIRHEEMQAMQEEAEMRLHLEMLSSLVDALAEAAA